MMAPLQAGFVIDGKYEVQRELAVGGMGTIYAAVHTTIHRPVAIKVLHPQYAKSREFTLRFMNEARAVNQIRHPAVTEIYDRGALPDQSLYLVMDLLPGEDLNRRLKRTGNKLSEPEVIRHGWAIADVLTAAHEAGIVHRDLKPSNIMLIPDDESDVGERIKLLDFGVAKILEDSLALTVSTETFGSVAYMAPEQCQSARNVDGKADVYSLGIMIFEMLTGQLPIGREKMNPLAMMRMQMEQPPLELSRVAPHLSPVLSRLVHSMLAKSRDARPTMAEVAQQLRQLNRAMVGRSGNPPYVPSAPASAPVSSDDAATLVINRPAQPQPRPAADGKSRS